MKQINYPTSLYKGEKNYTIKRAITLFITTILHKNTTQIQSLTEIYEGIDWEKKRIEMPAKYSTLVYILMPFTTAIEVSYFPKIRIAKMFCNKGITKCPITFSKTNLKSETSV